MSLDEIFQDFIAALNRLAQALEEVVEVIREEQTPEEEE